MTKNELVNQTEVWLVNQKLKYSNKDLNRPWGAFWNIAPDSTRRFLQLFFPDFNSKDRSLSPKILLIEPQKQLSLQLHFHRSEKWFVINGPVKVTQGNKQFILNRHQTVILEPQIPHRLSGLEQPGLVAEIWIHTDPHHPSTENDELRLEDDFHRSNPS